MLLDVATPLRFGFGVWTSTVFTASSPFGVWNSNQRVFKNFKWNKKNNVVSFFK